MFALLILVKFSFLPSSSFATQPVVITRECQSDLERDNQVAVRTAEFIRLMNFTHPVQRRALQKAKTLNQLRFLNVWARGLNFSLADATKGRVVTLFPSHLLFDVAHEADPSHHELVVNGLRTLRQIIGLPIHTTDGTLLSWLRPLTTELAALFDTKDRSDLKDLFDFIQTHKGTMSRISQELEGVESLLGRRHADLRFDEAFRLGGITRLSYLNRVQLNPPAAVKRYRKHMSQPTEIAKEIDTFTDRVEITIGRATHASIVTRGLPSREDFEDYLAQIEKQKKPTVFQLTVQQEQLISIARKNRRMALDFPEWDHLGHLAEQENSERFWSAAMVYSSSLDALIRRLKDSLYRANQLTDAFQKNLELVHMSGSFDKARAHDKDALDRLTLVARDEGQSACRHRDALDNLIYGLESWRFERDQASARGTELERQPKIAERLQHALKNLLSLSRATLSQP